MAFSCLQCLLPCCFSDPDYTQEDEMVNYPSSRRMNHGGGDNSSDGRSSSRASSAAGRRGKGRVATRGSYFGLQDEDEDEDEDEEYDEDEDDEENGQYASDDLSSPSSPRDQDGGQDDGHADAASFAHTPERLPATSLASFSPASAASPGALVDPDAFVLPGSALQAALALSMQDVVGKPGTEGDECVICMDTFTAEDPKMLTLCNCGMNKTNFHYSCLLQWTSKSSTCPSCRHELLWEEMDGIDVAGLSASHITVAQRDAVNESAALDFLGYVSSDDDDGDFVL
jgi:hypothetical protein